MKDVTVLGSYSGRNAGDAAILGNLIHDISSERPDVRFLIPTLSPKFINESFGDYNVKAMGLMPWNLAIKILGLPTLLSMIKTDMVLITDNALFDRKYYNPLVNFLFTISLIAPLCKKRGIPIVFYNASVGPIFTKAGKRALQKVLDASPLVILRDPESEELLQSLNLTYPDAILKADCAINTSPSPVSRMDAIFAKERLFQNPKGTISFNINAYIDNWIGAAFTRNEFLKIIGKTVDHLIEKLDVDIVFLVTQVMDYKITEECLQYIKNNHRVRVVGNKKYTYQDIVGIIAKAELHIGLRTHSLIFSAAVNVPMISINSYPKNKGFMRSIKQDEWMIEFEDLSLDRLTTLICDAWDKREKTRAKLKPIVEQEQKKARSSVALISDLL